MFLCFSMHFLLAVINVNILVALAKEYCKVTFAFDASNEDELSLKEGDIIHILSKVNLTWKNAIK